MKKRYRYLLIFFILYISLLIFFPSGCVVTGITYQYFGYPEPQPCLEFKNKKQDFKNELYGEYLGQKIIREQTFGHVLIKSSPEWCRGNSTIDLLVPLDKYSDRKAILQDSLISQMTSGKPVEIIFNPRPGKYLGEVDSLLPVESWKGGSVSIVL